MVIKLQSDGSGRDLKGRRRVVIKVGG